MKLITLAFSLYTFHLSSSESYDTFSARDDVTTLKSNSSDIFFNEQFQDKENWLRWIQSQGKKTDGKEYNGDWSFEIAQSSVYNNDYGLVLKSPCKFHGISARLNEPFQFLTPWFIVQYEVKFQKTPTCGGAYIKLLSDESNSLDLKQLTDKTPFAIMFGPDKCGPVHKYHFIIHFRNPKTGIYTEHYAKSITEPIDSYFTDKRSHLYTLILSSDNNYEMYIDNKLINSGNLLHDMIPPIIPPKEIFDEIDHELSHFHGREKFVDTVAKKSKSWDETTSQGIVDESTKMPDGWLENESYLIADPNAKRPNDWNDEINGEWAPPMIDNPLCKNTPGCGKWIPPSIGKSSCNDQPLPRKIPNPDYFEPPRLYRLTPIVAIAIELWSTIDNIVFDNFLITSNRTIAKQYAEQLWKEKFILEERFLSTTTKNKEISNAVDFHVLTRFLKNHIYLLIIYLIFVIFFIIFIIFTFCSPKSKDNNHDHRDARKTNVNQYDPGSNRKKTQ